MNRLRLGEWLFRGVRFFMCLCAVWLLNSAFAYPHDVTHVSSAPLLQETAYPVELDTPTLELTNAYPAPDESQTPVPTLDMTATAGTPIPTPTETLTPTLAPNILRTEDAQMQGAQGTPPATETPGGPTRTAEPDPTGSASPSTTPTVIFASSTSGPRIHWGFFWLGFALPALAACAWVLLLLDRQPNFFRRVPKR